MKINSSHLLGICWFVLSLAVSSVNDVLTKYLGEALSVYQIVFLRFFFGTAVLLPLFFFHNISFVTKRPLMHLARGALLFFGIALWCLGLCVGKIALATTLNFTIPIFVLVLARIFLGERFNTFKVLGTMLGLIGVVIALNPTSSVFNVYSLSLLASALMFASLDVINKKFVIKESMLNMVFYSSFITMLFALVPTVLVWVHPSPMEWALLFVLGIGANLILYCLLKSFALIEASVAAPYRYIELLFSAFFGYVIFHETLDRHLALGAAVIVVATLLVMYESVLRERRRQKVT